MSCPIETAMALLALSLPASAQISLVQKTPAEIGAPMTLEITNAVPGTPLYLLGFGALDAVPGGPGHPWFGIYRLLPLGISNGFGSLTVALQIPDASVMLGQVLPMRVKGSGGAPGGGTVSNPRAAWFGPHPIASSPTPQTSGGYGWAVAIGDFLGGPELDLAVGAVLETVSGAFGAGRVHVYEGPDFTSLTTLVSPTPQVGGDFGWALAALDFDGDGDTDLAVGEPGHDAAFPLSNIGAVNVFLHPVGSGGVTAYVDPTPIANEQLGVALAAGDLDAAPADELVAAANFYGAVQPAGALASVLILTTSGGPVTFSEVFEPNALGGQFGNSLAVGDTDGVGFHEILAGEPNHDEPGAIDAGAVHLIEAGVVTLSLIDDAPASGEKFGTSVAIGDLDADEEIAQTVGVQHENEAKLFLAPGFTGPSALSPAHPGDIHAGRAVAIADVNGDGALDALVAAGSCSAPGPGIVCGSVSAYLGPALAASGYVADAAIHPWALAAGDVDADGRAEIAIGDPNASPLFLSGAGVVLLSE